MYHYEYMCVLGSGWTNATMTSVVSGNNVKGQHWVIFISLKILYFKRGFFYNKTFGKWKLICSTVKFLIVFHVYLKRLAGSELKPLIIYVLKSDYFCRMIILASLFIFGHFCLLALSFVWCFGFAAAAERYTLLC